MSELEKRAKDTEEMIKALRTQAAAQGGPEQPMAMPTSLDEKKLDYIS